jgi:(p)ppGpp synthase/HD superfamily hydrolase
LIDFRIPKFGQLTLKAGYMSTLDRAIQIAMKAHKGQTDRYGNPYILHPLRVMSMGRTDEERIVGVLHDVVEDSDWTFEDLRKEGYSKRIVDALDCVTKRSDNEDYDVFLERTRKNPLSVRVKLNDLIDNMDIRRMNQVQEKDVKRLNKYLRAYRILAADLDGHGH